MLKKLHFRLEYANIITVIQSIYWWCSILVRRRCVEGGDKISPKGTSMKFLVLASVAQTGAGAGS